MPSLMWKVALIYDATHAYDMKVMTGVAAYLHDSGNYNVYVERNALKDQRLPTLHSWDGDGIIANFDHPTVARAVTKSRLPAVAFGSGRGWYVPDRQFRISLRIIQSSRPWRRTICSHGDSGILVIVAMFGLRSMVGRRNVKNHLFGFYISGDFHAMSIDPVTRQFNLGHHCRSHLVNG